LILTINELAVTILVAPPGLTPLSVRIYSLFHFNKAAEVASMCLIMAFLVVLLYIILASVISKDKDN
jgi:ABC-type spermidine/putrescine transport system permease subunit II